MFEFKLGNLLLENVEALVNTVNCVGVMGKGIALQFKMAYPDNFKSYLKLCQQEKMIPGKVHIYETGILYNPKYIINFPTKFHWKGKSKLKDIEEGIDHLNLEIKRLHITSIAIPPLGCGLGGLEWNDVKPLILQKFHDLENVRIIVFEPKNTPSVESMPVVSEKPQLTIPRAIYICLMNLYRIPGYRMSYIELQKLAYFIQVTGIDLRLNFQKAKMGPYADNLKFVLQKLEGHYIRGYGDGTGSKEVYLLPNAYEEAVQFVVNSGNAKQVIHSINNVKRLIEGFETPYGLELLSTVHWVTKESNEINKEVITANVLNWNARKKKLFKPTHISIAFDHIIQNQMA